GRAIGPFARVGAIPSRNAALRARGYGPGPRQGGRRDPGADPSLRGRGDPAAGRWHQREFHRPPDRFPRDRRREDVLAPLAADRPDRGDPARARPPGQALLPARTHRARGPDQGAKDL
ncbi:MAG: LSU ribosomal protein L19p, partial [uncultured Thermomicrobiales bacterium]